MLIKAGFRITYDCPQPTPMLLMLNIHHSHVDQLVRPDHLATSNNAKIVPYRDGFGNLCGRMEAPIGRTTISSEAVVRVSSRPDPVVPGARQHPIWELPEETLVYLLGSRYCESDEFTEFAWDRFGKTPLGWDRVQAICNFVHDHIRFDYMQARPTRTALDAYNERVGVCRDYAHLAIALCRCLNIPARYCTGYLGDVGILPPHGPMDFAGWFEAFLGGHWHVFDARNNIPRIGRILIARGRDAVDVAISTTFGPNTLVEFTVICEEIVEQT